MKDYKGEGKYTPPPPSLLRNIMYLHIINTNSRWIYLKKSWQNYDEYSKICHYGAEF